MTLAVAPAAAPAAPAKTPGILERLSSLEETVRGLAGYSQQEFGQVKQTMTNLVEVLNGVISASGDGFADKVQAAILDLQKKRMAEQVEREKALLKQLVDNGALVVADKIGEQSVIVGREYNTEGEVLGSGRVQVRFSQFTPDAKAKMLGQAVGFLLEVETGKFEVLEVYDPAPPKEAVPSGPAPEAAPAPAAEAAPAAPAEATPAPAAE